MAADLHDRGGVGVAQVPLQFRLVERRGDHRQNLFTGDERLAGDSGYRAERRDAEGWSRGLVEGCTTDEEKKGARNEAVSRG